MAAVRHCTRFCTKRLLQQTTRTRSLGQLSLPKWLNNANNFLFIDDVPCFHSPTWCAYREYSKKTKGKEKGKQHKSRITLSDEEISSVLDLNRVKEKMEKVLEALKDDFIHNLSLRTSIGSFDLLMVDTEDGQFPLNQLGQIVQKSSNLMLINMAMCPQYIPAVRKALESSGMNIQVQQETTTLFIPIPKVSREHREKLAKSAKTLCNSSKEKLRNIYNKSIKEINREAGISSDLVHNVETLVLDTLHEYMAAIDKSMKQKVEELLQEKR